MGVWLILIGFVFGWCFDFWLFFFLVWIECFELFILVDMYVDFFEFYDVVFFFIIINGKFF